MTATVYTGGRIFTRGRAALADALVVDGDTVAVRGRRRTRDRLAAGPDAATVDLGGRLLVPGFTDAHTHLVMMGEALGRVGLTDARTLGEIQERLRAAREARPDAARLLGRGWLFDSVPGGAPTAAMIDAVVGDVPVYLDANDYHSWLGQPGGALASSGITRDTPDPSAAASGGMPTASPTACSTRPRLRRLRVGAPRRADPRRRPRRRRRAHARRLCSRPASPGCSTWRSTSSGSPRSTAAAERRGGRLPLRVAAHWFVENTGDEAANLGAGRPGGRTSPRRCDRRGCGWSASSWWSTASSTPAPPRCGIRIPTARTPSPSGRSPT